MHPVSIFPQLLDYGQLSPFIIRLAIGSVLLFWAYKTIRNASASAQMKALGLLETIAGILLLIGLWTQAAALVVGIDLIMRLIGRIKSRAFLTDGVNYYLLLLVLVISLMITGAGWWAFDLAL